MLSWLFGGVTGYGVHVNGHKRMSGFLELERADVSWFLSVDVSDLPFAPVPGKSSTFRSITVDGQEMEFTEGFTDLHTRVYERTLAGEGFGIEDARPSIELVYRLRKAPITPPGDLAHPYLSHPS
jgi:UDP-N-acetyl-2-amino-2-deoxyglucuronate dehydrogenase